MLIPVVFDPCWRCRSNSKDQSGRLVYQLDLASSYCHSANTSVKLLDVYLQGFWVALGNTGSPSKRYIKTGFKSNKPMVRHFKVRIRISFFHFFLASAPEPQLFDFDAFTS